MGYGRRRRLREYVRFTGESRRIRFQPSHLNTVYIQEMVVSSQLDIAACLLPVRLNTILKRRYIGYRYQ